MPNEPKTELYDLIKSLPESLNNAISSKLEQKTGVPGDYLLLIERYFETEKVDLNQIISFIKKINLSPNGQTYLIGHIIGKFINISNQENISEQLSNISKLAREFNVKLDFKFINSISDCIFLRENLNIDPNSFKEVLNKLNQLTDVKNTNKAEDLFLRRLISYNKIKIPTNEFKNIFNGKINLITTDILINSFTDLFKSENLNIDKAEKLASVITLPDYNKIQGVIADFMYREYKKNNKFTDLYLRLSKLKPEFQISLDQEKLQDIESNEFIKIATEPNFLTNYEKLKLFLSESDFNKFFYMNFEKLLDLDDYGYELINSAGIKPDNFPLSTRTLNLESSEKIIKLTNSSKLDFEKLSLVTELLNLDIFNSTISNYIFDQTLSGNEKIALNFIKFLSLKAYNFNLNYIESSFINLIEKNGFEKFYEKYLFIVKTIPQFGEIAFKNLYDYFQEDPNLDFDPKNAESLKNLRYSLKKYEKIGDGKFFSDKVKDKIHEILQIDDIEEKYNLLAKVFKSTKPSYFNSNNEFIKNYFSDLLNLLNDNRLETIEKITDLIPIDYLTENINFDKNTLLNLYDGIYNKLEKQLDIQDEIKLDQAFKILNLFKLGQIPDSFYIKLIPQYFNYLSPDFSENKIELFNSHYAKYRFNHQNEQFKNILNDQILNILSNKNIKINYNNFFRFVYRYSPIDKFSGEFQTLVAKLIKNGDLETYDNIISFSQNVQLIENYQFLKELNQDYPVDIFNIFKSFDIEEIKKLLTYIRVSDSNEINSISSPDDLLIFILNKKLYSFFDMLTYDVNSTKLSETSRKYWSLVNHADIAPVALKLVKSNSNKIDENLISRLEKIKNMLSKIEFLHRDTAVYQNLLEGDIEENLIRIISMLRDSNLPSFIKNFHYFELKYANKNTNEDTQISSTLLTGSNLGRISPVLADSSDIKRISILWRDYLKIAIESNSQELILFLNKIEVLIKQISEIETLKSNLQDSDLTNLRNLLNSISRISGISRFRFLDKIDVTNNESFQKTILDFKDSHSESFSQKLRTWLVNFYIKPLGFDSPDAIKKHAHNTMKQAEERNISQARNGFIKIKNKDLIRGIGFKDLKGTLELGSVSREFIGIESGSDTTPFDIDLVSVRDNGDEIENRYLLENSGAFYYASGGYILLIRDRDQFQRSDDLDSNREYQKNKYELFNTGYIGIDHYGIRTGLPTSEITAIIVPTTEEKTKAEIDILVQNALDTLIDIKFYIPITDIDGNVIVTYEEFISKLNNLK
jgi:hypothetical protein